MSDIEKAIKLYKEIAKDKNDEIAQIVLQALEKQIPVKIEKSNTRAYGYCPECGKVFWDKWENEYCENCGQKLDWSEVQE